MPELAPATPPTDSELVEEILGGRLEAYDELMKRYERLVYKAAWGFGGSHENAMDLSQAVFLKAYRRLSTFTGRGEFKSWLMQIASNEGVSWLRSNRRHVQGRESLEADSRGLALAPAGAVQAEQEMEQLEKEQQRILLHGLGRLSRRYRTALVLRYLHGLSVREVASILECTEGTAKNVLFRGVRNLRKQVVRA